MRCTCREAALLDLVGELYRAAMDPAHWSLALAKVSSVVDCAAVLLYAVDHRNKDVPLAISHNFPAKMLREGQDHYFQASPRQACSLAHRDQPVYDHMHISEAEIDRSEHYAWLQEGGFRYYIGAALAEVNGLATYISLQRSPRHGHVDQHEIATFGRLLPHLKQAVALSAAFRSLEARTLALADALYTSGMAVILLDRRGQVVFMTEAAQRIVARADSLLVDREGRVRAGLPEEGRRLGRVIADVTGMANGDGLAAGGDLLVSRSSGGEPLRVRVAPLRDLEAPVVGVPVAAALVIHDPEARPRPVPEHLCRHYGLTVAEAKLATALADGVSLKDHAESSGISYETARWHLKRVLAKTDTTRQAGLVSLVLQHKAVA